MNTSVKSFSCASLLLLLTYLTASAQKAELYVQTGHTSNVTSVAFNTDGTLMATGSDDKTIKLWDVASGLQLRTFRRDSALFKDVVFSPDGELLAAGDSSEAVKLWNVKTGEYQCSLSPKSDGSTNTVPEYLTGFAFSPDSKYLVTVSIDHVRLWEVSTGRFLRFI